MAAKYFVILLLAVVLAHAAARNIPNDKTEKKSEATNPSATTNALAPVQNTENVVSTTANAPAANGVDDQKNFITYGGVGGWAGIGGFAGVVPALGGLGGLGGGPGGSGLGGLGGLGGGAGGLGGLGGLGGGTGVGGGVGGGKGGIVP